MEQLLHSIPSFLQLRNMLTELGVHNVPALLFFDDLTGMDVPDRGQVKPREESNSFVHQVISAGTDVGRLSDGRDSWSRPEPSCHHAADDRPFS
jgi:hypothetical protein